MSTAMMILRLLHVTALGSELSPADLMAGLVCGAGFVLILGIVTGMAVTCGRRHGVPSQGPWPHSSAFIHTPPTPRGLTAGDYTTRHAAVMFTDAVGFSAAMERDESATLRSLAEDLGLIHEECMNHGGQVVKTVGDGILALFDSPFGALRCARSIQRRMAGRHMDAARLIHRIGIHAGDIRLCGGEVMGATVNIAARLEKEAPAGGICLSREAAQGAALPHDAVHRGARVLRNIIAPVDLYMVPAPALGLGQVIELRQAPHAQGRDARTGTGR